MIFDNEKQAENSKNFVRGGQIILNNWRMTAQIASRLFMWWIAIVIAITALFCYIFLPMAQLVNAGWYIKAKCLLLLHLNQPTTYVWINHETFNLSAQDLLAVPQVNVFWLTFIKNLVIIGSISLILSTLIIWSVSAIIRRYGAKVAKQKVISGDTFEPLKKVKQLIIAAKCASTIKIDDLPLIQDSEVRNFMIHGTQGSGKSQLIRKFLNEVRKRGEKAVVYDKGCDLIPSFYQEGDIILNPFDIRCANWSLWSECQSIVDFENMANALIPKQGNESDPFWVNAARTILANGAASKEAKEKASIIYLLSRLLTSSLESMADLLKGTAAESLVDPKIEKTAISIKSVLATYLKSLCFLDGLKGEPFSIRKWIEDQNDKRWLFISSRDEDHASIRPLISMWLDIATSRLLSLSRDENRRLWFVLDEMSSLHKLPYLPATFAEARKFGGCFIIGLQSIAQLQALYGMKEAQTISGQCNTRFYFRSPDNETAMWSSKELGEIEVEEVRESFSYGASTMRDGRSISQQRYKRPLISPSDIVRLKDLHAYIRLPGDWPITQIILKYQKPEISTSGFIKRHINEHALEDITKLVNQYEQPIAKTDSDEKNYTRKPNLESVNDSIFG